MDKLFLTVLNMSLTASYVIAFVIAIRLFLKKFPKNFSYLLWIAVLFRLICPFSFDSIVSLIPKNINILRN
jgi:beta-lactamase regulating signal transducer with metallopeptidase domain